jgi:hypothetical protein
MSRFEAYRDREEALHGKLHLYLRCPECRGVQANEFGNHFRRRPPWRDDRT